MSESKIKLLNGGGDVSDHPSFAHLKPYERASRILCGKLGINPSELVECANPTGLAIPAYRPQWMDAALDLIHLSNMLAAMKEAAEEEKQNAASFPKSVN